ncbi:type II toxin-antitoxin system death-on-curing family toxin [Fervidibacter sacchari]
MQVRYLTADEIEDLHEQIILRYGGVSGLLSRDLLESASARPQTAILGQELYPTLEEKAAALMHSIIADHPFADGNKRTAFLATQEFLRLNGYEIVVETREALEFTLAIAEGKLGVHEIADWLRRHIRPTPRAKE